MRAKAARRPRVADRIVITPGQGPRSRSATRYPCSTSTTNLADALIDADGTWPPKLVPLSQLARSGMNGPLGSAPNVRHNRTPVHAAAGQLRSRRSLRGPSRVSASARFIVTANTDTSWQLVIWDPARSDHEPAGWHGVEQRPWPIRTRCHQSATCGRLAALALTTERLDTLGHGCIQVALVNRLEQSEAHDPCPGRSTGAHEREVDPHALRSRSRSVSIAAAVAPVIGSAATRIHLGGGSAALTTRMRSAELVCVREEEIITDDDQPNAFESG